MATKFGKELRKLRIDTDENISNMAEKLDISISYLSAIEAGTRNIPADLVDKLVKEYHLTEERRETLRQAEAESAKDLEICLESMTPEQRKLAFALSRKLTDITDQECLEILEKLK